MPDPVFGSPTGSRSSVSVPTRTRGVKSTYSDVVTKTSPGVDVESIIPSSRFSTHGPTPAGTVTVTVSQNQNGCAKYILIRLYRDGVPVSGGRQQMTVDSEAGTDRTYTIEIPADISDRLRSYYLTWSSTCGTGTMASASRINVVSVNWYPQAITPVYSDPLDDTFKTGAIHSRWANPLTSAGHLNVISYTPDGLTLKGNTNNKRAYGIRQTIGRAVSFRIVAWMNHVTGGNDLRGGIYVAVTGGKGNICGPFLQDSAPAAIGVTTTSQTADWSTYDGYQAVASGSVTVLRAYRIDWDKATSTLTFAYSNDGGGWVTIGSRESMSQPTECGLVLYSNSGAIQTTAALFASRWSFTPR